jgi:hypothetical protein
MARDIYGYMYDAEYPAIPFELGKEFFYAFEFDEQGDVGDTNGVMVVQVPDGLEVVEAPKSYSAHGPDWINEEYGSCSYNEESKELTYNIPLIRNSYSNFMKVKFKPTKSKGVLLTGTYLSDNKAVAPLMNPTTLNIQYKEQSKMVNRKLKFICESAIYPVFRDWKISLNQGILEKFMISGMKSFSGGTVKAEIIDPAADPLIDPDASALVTEVLGDVANKKKDMSIAYKSLKSGEYILRVSAMNASGTFYLNPIMRFQKRYQDVLS